MDFGGSQVVQFVGFFFSKSHFQSHLSHLRLKIGVFAHTSVIIVGGTVDRNGNGNGNGDGNSNGDGHHFFLFSLSSFCL